MQISEGVIHTILHIIRKPNSIIMVLLFAQNISRALRKPTFTLTTYNNFRCKFYFNNAELENK